MLLAGLTYDTLSMVLWKIFLPHVFPEQPQMTNAEDEDAEADEEDGGGLGGALPGGGAEGEGAAEVDGKEPEEGAQATLAAQQAHAVQAERGHAVAEGLPECIEDCLGDGEDHGDSFP